MAWRASIKGNRPDLKVVDVGANEPMDFGLVWESGEGLGAYIVIAGYRIQAVWRKAVTTELNGGPE